MIFERVFAQSAWKHKRQSKQLPKGTRGPPRGVIGAVLKDEKVFARQTRGAHGLQRSHLCEYVSWKGLSDPLNPTLSFFNEISGSK